MAETAPGLAAVAIGRNEGERLVRCLASLRAALGEGRIVYVDSGSTDGSVAAARAAGVEVVELDAAIPFTAARARNAGLARLRQGGAPDLVQLVDGDCELQPGWIAAATAFLAAHPQAAVACGRRRERFPEASVWNRFCDAEWDTPVGRTRGCGGDALARMAALDEVGGFDPGMIAGEDSEMCLRLRNRGWEIWRLQAEMTLHDAAMTRFSQFWQRSRRAGYFWAEATAMHGRSPERFGVPGLLRALFWGLGLPAAAILGALLTPWTLLLLAAYPLQIARQALRSGGDRFAWQQSALMTLSKFAEVHGIAGYVARRLRSGAPRLIEYK